jgi:predicted nucleic acid-binding protein
VTRVDVVDASAFAAVTFLEPDSEAVFERFADRRMLAPALVVFEVANVLWNKLRKWRSDADRPRLESRFEEFLRLPVELCEVDLPAAMTLGLVHGLTASDACYVWPAHGRNAGLVTLDRQMARVASIVLAK